MGLALVYLVMVAQFESWTDPFVIMFSVPFAATGFFGVDRDRNKLIRDFIWAHYFILVSL